MAKLSKIIKIKQADYSTLLSEGQVTINDVTHVYDPDALYTITDPADPEYAERAGYAASAGTSEVAIKDASGNNIVNTYLRKDEQDTIVLSGEKYGEPIYFLTAFYFFLAQPTGKDIIFKFGLNEILDDELGSEGIDKINQTLNEIASYEGKNVFIKFSIGEPITYFHCIGLSYNNIIFGCETFFLNVYLKHIEEGYYWGISVNDSYTFVTKIRINDESLLSSNIEGIVDLSEVIQSNVQSDWNATEGDAVILNKPNIPTVSVSQTATPGVTTIAVNSSVRTVVSADEPLGSDHEYIAPSWSAMQAALRTKEMTLAIITTNSAPLAVNTYYRHVSDGINKLTVILPNVSSATTVQHIMLYFKTGSNPTFTINTSGDAAITYVDGYSINANTEYEISFLWNGAKWIVAYNILGS